MKRHTCPSHHINDDMVYSTRHMVIGFSVAAKQGTA